ncbi:hypothetical protein EYW49_04780 [Siculibacillus lacustris]|uniref:M23ase beta-sheet core domain-containing protein n=1 Tax=Siculibacillus lacustris TaxID=1549641 RepID=A0A4Q9VUV6_9HYPH|nr:peptidoglycan DD-metalloendopeptidase family protein [Siculibacillus lacustris]TBW39988.1 hypothetical protein EYW49_04780 [Siculibacillus lacustris]
MAAAAWVLALVCVPAGAQEARPAPPAAVEAPSDAAARRATTRAELEAIQHDVELGRERQAEIRREIDALERDRTRVAERLVESATRTRALEAALTAGEARIDGLDGRAAVIRASLSARRGVLADVLAALQRIGRKPPPAILVRPEDARGAVRSAILVGALLPGLRAEAETLLADLEALEALKATAAGERDRYRAEAGDLASERTRLELLIEERRRSKSDQERRLADESRRTAESAQKAAGLEELIGRLDREAVVRPPPPEAEKKLAALGDAGRLQPAFAFAEARGKLPQPVGGPVVRHWGEDDGFGAPSRGVTFAARTDARVSSPCDGWVIFLGPFRSYGKLLIINGGGGYHVVLAGLARIDVEAGQFVLAGEPVGTMGGGGPAATTTAAGPERSALYVEFRKDNTSIDPSPWWASTRDEKVRG